MKNYLTLCLFFTITSFTAFNLTAQVGGQNCNSATVVNIPSDGSFIEVSAIYDQYTSASNQGLHPCVGTVAPDGIGPDTWFKFEATADQVVLSDLSGLVNVFLYSGTCSQLTIADYFASGNYNGDCISQN